MYSKRKKPYEVKQGEGGVFLASGSEAIDSPPVALRMPKSMYEKVESTAGGRSKMAAWIRDAIAAKLQEVSDGK